MKFTITTTLDVPVGNFLKKRLLYIEDVESSLADDVRGSLERGDFLLSRSIGRPIKIGRVTVRKKV